MAEFRFLVSYCSIVRGQRQKLMKNESGCEVVAGNFNELGRKECVTASGAYTYRFSGATTCSITLKIFRIKHFVEIYVLDGKIP